MASKRPVNSSNSVTGFEMTWATVTCGGAPAAELVAASFRPQADRVAATTARTERVRAGLEKDLKPECMRTPYGRSESAGGAPSLPSMGVGTGCRYWCPGPGFDTHLTEGGGSAI